MYDDLQRGALGDRRSAMAGKGVKKYRSRVRSENGRHARIELVVPTMASPDSVEYK